MLNRRKRNGFALLAVIWGLGVISLLITSFMSNGRLRVQMAFNVAGATQARLAADGAINATILSLLSERDGNLAQTDHPVHDGAPRFCSLSGAAVAVVVEDEGGKVDINSASPKLLQAMLMGFGVEMRRADALANAIVTFRSRQTSDITPAGQTNYEVDKPPPKQALFQTVMELDQVNGFDAPLFSELILFVTVHSRSQGMDARAAPPALFAALAGFSANDVQALIGTPFPNALDRSDPRFPRPFNQGSDHGAFLLHAETFLSGGQTAVREAVVDLRASGVGPPYAIRELRRGATRYIDQLRSIAGSGAAMLPDC